MPKNLVNKGFLYGKKVMFSQHTTLLVFTSSVFPPRKLSIQIVV